MTALGNFVQGQKLTAADMNEIGDLVTFTPTYTAGVTVGNATVNTGRYYRLNDILYCQVNFTAGSTSTFNNPLTMTVPAGLSLTGYAAGDIIGIGGMTDNAVATYSAVVYVISSTSVQLYLQGTTGTFATLVGGGAFANLDYFNFNFWARVA